MNLLLSDPAFLSVAAGVALWTPAEITTALWLDAADASTITESGGAVSQWDDKSGNNRHFIQTTAEDRPTYDTTNKLNGKNITAFNSDYMIAETAWVNYTNGLHVFSVFRNRTSSTSLLFANRASSSSPETRAQSALLPSSSETFYRIFGYSIGAETWIGRKAPIPVLNQWYVTGALYDGGTTNSAITLYQNGTSVDNADDGSGVFSKQSTTSTTPLELGSQGGGTARITGDYAEFIIIQSSLSTTDRQKIEGYLAHKWGLTANLPAGHPYKSAAPTA